MNWNNKEYNKELVERFPFLLPRNVWTDEIVEEYDYEYTLLDEMPNGWRLAFGEQMCQEIMEVLEQTPYKDEYRIMQIKEKYGSLRWYSAPAPREVQEIVHKYEEISGLLCIRCGAPAEYITKGWINPLCGECTQFDYAGYYGGKSNKGFDFYYKRIEEYYSQENIDKVKNTYGLPAYKD